MTAPKKYQTKSKNHPFPSCSKTITAVLIVLLNIHAFAGNANITATTNHQSLLQAMAPADTIISGIVKDINGKPVANAKISSAITGDVYTNSDGLFSITLTTGKIVPQSFIFSYDTLMPVVRSYHPVMENAIYEIVLEPKKCCLRDLWMELMCNHTSESRLYPVSFQPNIARPSGNTKDILKEVAAKLKDNPELKITITAYPAPTDPKQRVTDKRLLNIVEYLIEQMGISSDRIITEKKPAEGDGNNIDLKIN